MKGGRMLGRNVRAPSPPETRTLVNRWGSVVITTQRLDGTYTRYTYEGQPDAVICAVAQQQSGVTEMYEHMFRIDSVVMSNARLTVVATRSNYAGD